MIKSLNEYIQKVEKKITNWSANYATTTHLWYRGISNEKHKLIPSLYRKGYDPSHERELVRDFQLSSQHLIKDTPSTYIEWLYIMQHYGIPTRLLDWSESYLVALYFAVEKYEEQDSNPAVWILKPWTLNENSINLKSVPTHQNKLIRTYELKEDIQGNIGRNMDAKYPVAIRAIRNNARISHQKGTFTIHGKSKTPLEDYIPIPQICKLKLERILIDKNYKKEIFRELFKAGITPSKIYPDLVGLCQEIKIRYSESYIFK